MRSLALGLVVFGGMSSVQAMEGKHTFMYQSNPVGREESATAENLCKRGKPIPLPLNLSSTHSGGVQPRAPMRRERETVFENGISIKRGRSADDDNEEPSIDRRKGEQYYMEKFEIAQVAFLLTEMSGNFRPDKVLGDEG